jgi:hypothetical protein
MRPNETETGTEKRQTDRKTDRKKIPVCVTCRQFRTQAVWNLNWKTKSEYRLQFASNAAETRNTDYNDSDKPL